MREIWEICGTHDILAHIKFWSFSTKERNCSLPQRMNEMTLLQQPVDIILIVVYYFYRCFLYSYFCLCILIVRPCILTVVYVFLLLSMYS
jgi:hypothetical protein